MITQTLQPEVRTEADEVDEVRKIKLREWLHELSELPPYYKMISGETKDVYFDDTFGGKYGEITRSLGHDKSLRDMLFSKDFLNVSDKAIHTEEVLGVTYSLLPTQIPGIGVCEIKSPLYTGNAFTTTYEFKPLHPMYAEPLSESPDEIILELIEKSKKRQEGMEKRSFILAARIKRARTQTMENIDVDFERADATIKSLAVLKTFQYDMSGEELDAEYWRSLREDIRRLNKKEATSRELYCGMELEIPYYLNPDSENSGSPADFVFLQEYFEAFSSAGISVGMDDFGELSLGKSRTLDVQKEYLKVLKSLGFFVGDENQDPPLFSLHFNVGIPEGLVKMMSANPEDPERIQRDFYKTEKPPFSSFCKFLGVNYAPLGRLMNARYINEGLIKSDGSDSTRYEVRNLAYDPSEPIESQVEKLQDIKFFVEGYMYGTLYSDSYPELHKGLEEFQATCQQFFEIDGRKLAPADVALDDYRKEKIHVATEKLRTVILKSLHAPVAKRPETD